MKEGLGASLSKSVVGIGAHGFHCLESIALGLLAALASAIARRRGRIGIGRRIGIHIQIVNIIDDTRHG